MRFLYIYVLEITNVVTICTLYALICHRDIRVRGFFFILTQDFTFYKTHFFFTLTQKDIIAFPFPY